MVPTLYAHQQEMVDKLRASLAKYRATILCANPGVGKTRISKYIAAKSIQHPPRKGQSGNVLFAVHRRGLVDNASQSYFEEPELPHGVIMTGEETAFNNRVQVASIDTLLSWHVENGVYNSKKTYDLIIFDETHAHFQKLFTYRAAHDKQRRRLELIPSFYIGLSATPAGDGLADGFKDIVQGPSTEWLIENGYLSPFRYFRGRVCDGDSLNGASVVAEWLKYGQGRPTVGFFPRLSHARDAQHELNRAGIRAEYVDAKTKDHTRRQLFKDLAKGHIDFLCNCGIVERGTNIPEIGCIQLCAKLGSMVRYRQMVGRGSRPASAKTDCIVLDHGNNVARFGFFEDDPPWSLDRSRSVESEHAPRAVVSCPKCGLQYRGGKCRACNYEPTSSEFKAQGLVFNGRELVEIKRNKPTKTSQQTAEQIMVSSLYMAARSGRTYKQAIGIAYSRAKRQGVPFRVPRQVLVGRDVVRMLDKGHPQECWRVRDIYPKFVK